MLDLLLKPSFGIPFVPECLLMVLYHYVVHIIVRNRSQFKPSFVVLIVLGCIMNTLAFGNSFITARVPRNTAENDTFSDFFKSHDIVNNIENFSWIQISHTLHYSFAYSQYFYHSFFCLNRFIGIAFPKNCEKIWKKSFWPVVIIIFFVPVLIVHRILFGRSFYRMGENGDFFWIDSTYSRANIYTIMVPATSFCTVFNISVNIICYLKIRRKERESHSDQRLRKMILVCLLIDSSLLILTFCNFYLNVWSSVKESPIFSGWVFFMIPYASDVLTLSTPLQLLLFSKNIRRMCIENVPYLRHYKGHTFFNHTTAIAYVNSFSHRSSI
uniref:Serpentine receptor class gamma n=3 Tax=Caenorhabditis briggsae TaxID=6238 RepID=G8IPQ8_CAEBR|nr:chemoreceptor [Caenorhabditis briggsae]